MLSEMAGKGTAGMLICAMFATRLNWAVRGMFREVLTGVLPVVQSSTGVVLRDERDQRFPRLLRTVTSSGWGSCGRGRCHGSCSDGQVTMGVHWHRTHEQQYYSHQLPVIFRWDDVTHDQLLVGQQRHSSVLQTHVIPFALCWENSLSKQSKDLEHTKHIYLDI